MIQKKSASAMLLAAAIVIGGSSAANAACVVKGGKGWGADLEGAQFQAWEAVLQATNWGMWSVWISGSAKVGQAAAGYSVSNVRSKCTKQDGQTVCVYSAKLCS